MLDKFFKAVAAALGSGLYRVVLNRRSDGFALHVFQRSRPIPLSAAATNLQPLARFARLTTRPDGSAIIPPNLLADVKSVLHSLAQNGLDASIASDVLALQLVNVPAQFHVRYAWDQKSRSLVLNNTHYAAYLGDGWFVGATYYWLVPGMKAEDDGWLRHNIVDRRNIFVLVSQVVPNWRQRGLPFDCGVSYNPSPALIINVHEIHDEVVELDIAWQVPDRSVLDIPSLPGYVVAADTLMPGVSPQTLLQGLPAASGHLQLSGQQIPRFMRETWPVIQQFVHGDTNALTKTHSILDSSPELILAVSNELVKGLGVASASPKVLLGNERLSAAEISRQLDAHVEYIRTRSGWLPSSSITRLGIGSLWQLDSRMTINAITFSPAEVLKRGSERLDGPWSRIEFPDALLPQGRSPLETTRQHIEFLRKWRIPGGIVSASQDILHAFADSVASVVSEFPEAKVLVIGTQGTLSSLNVIWDRYGAIHMNGLAKDPRITSDFRGLVTARPRAFDTAPNLLSIHWTIVCLLKGDMFVQSEASKISAHLRRCQKSLVMGLFENTDFLKRPTSREAILRIFHGGVNGTLELFEKYGLRDPTHPAPALPPPYQLRHRLPAPSKEVRPAEIALPGPNASVGLPVPPRPIATRLPTPSRPVATHADRHEPELNKISITAEKPNNFAYGYANDSAKFMNDARRLFGYREQRASFVSFKRLSPTYDAMNLAQRRWYFYWRGQVRDHKYPDTDLSYIFLHVYELINNVGVTGVKDGAEQLWRVWVAYRERFPRLDIYLTDWLLDYLLVNRSEAQMMKAHLDALPPGARLSDPDLFLAYFIVNPSLHLPAALIEALVDYRFSKSKFAVDGHQPLLNKTIADVVNHVNSYLITASGGGIFDQFKPQGTEALRRDLFRSALYGTSAAVYASVNVIPYSTHPPLRKFLTALVKHTENRLRELNGYEGRLRGYYSIDLTIQTVIDEFLGYKAKAADIPVINHHAEAPRRANTPQIVVDMSKVVALQKQSDEVQRILLKGLEAADDVLPIPVAQTPGEVPVEQSPIGPPQSEDEQDPTGTFFSKLSHNEGQILEILAAHSWSVERSVLDKALLGQLLEPLIDQINELATTWLGDILLTPEGDHLVANDDLRSELARYIETPVAKSPIQTARAVAFSDLPMEWAAFAAALSAQQVETLRAIMDLRDPMPAIRAIATSAATMPAALIDSINELALATVGDYVIEPGSESPTIEDSHRELMDTLLAEKAS